MPRERVKPDRAQIAAEANAMQAALDEDRRGNMSPDDVANYLAGSARAAKASDNQGPGDRNSPQGGNDDDDDEARRQAEHDEYFTSPSTPDEDDDEEDGDASTPDEGDDDAEEAGEEDTGEPEEDEEGDEDEDVSDAAFDDGTEVPVTVDGEEKLVTLRDLKKAYAGEGAIEKRLKEATELRKQADNARTGFFNVVEQQQQNLQAVLETMAQSLFAPLVEKPDAALRQKDMNAYLMQKDAFDEDQKRLAGMQQQMAQVIQQQTEARNKVRQSFRQEQMQLLAQKLPDLADPEKGKTVSKEIMDAARHYGFDDQAIAQVDDHRLYLMARDAANWLKLQSMKQKANSPKRGNEKPTRRLRAGGAPSTKAKVQQQARETAAIRKRAEQSGDVNDIASMLVAQTTRRPR